MNNKCTHESYQEDSARRYYYLEPESLVAKALQTRDRRNIDSFYRKTTIRMELRINLAHPTCKGERFEVRPVKDAYALSYIGSNALFLR
jgi:hypothetical protein